MKRDVIFQNNLASLILGENKRHPAPSLESGQTL
jgi:hypothetical protein